MGLNKKAMMVKVGVVLSLMAVIIETVEARREFSPKALLPQAADDNGGANYYIKSTAATACCNSCPCTKSIPPQCHCRDVGQSCHSACNLCPCTRSIPPKCHCLDTTNFCYPPCS